MKTSLKILKCFLFILLVVFLLFLGTYGIFNLQPNSVFVEIYFFIYSEKLI